LLLGYGPRVGRYGLNWAAMPNPSGSEGTVPMAPWSELSGWPESAIRSAER